MSHPTVLRSVVSNLRYEKFDPSTPDHLAAFAMLVRDGKQHSTLRFHLEHPFVNVRAMMESKVCDAYLQARGI
jgi:hypothetical protein